MGFNPWTAFRANLNQAAMLEVAQAVVSSGLRDAGYVYINLDCGWTTGYRENATGRLQVNTRKFPNMTDYGRQLHAMGLKFGMYAGGVHAQCCHRGGGNDTSLGHWDTDVQQFAEWGIDYLKSDPCCGSIANRTSIFDEYNTQWAAAFRRIGYLDRVFYQGSGPGRASNNTNLPSLLNSWRTTADVKPTFDSVMHNIQDNDKYAALAGPHHWNDADMLQCGQPGITLAECRLMLSLWSLAKSPLLLGADVRRFPTSVVELLTNAEVIA
eukprot:gene1826-17844_t